MYKMIWSLYVDKLNVNHKRLIFDREDFKHVCELTIQDIHDMERHVNSLLIQHIVDTFKETTEPLYRLTTKVVKYQQVGSAFIYHPPLCIFEAIFS